MIHHLAYFVAGLLTGLATVAVAAAISLTREIDNGRIDPDWWS